MIIKISRSGGFAGIEEELGTINTGILQEEAAARAENSVAELMHVLDETGAYPPVGADMFRYEIGITDEEGRHQKLTLVDEGDPESPSMRALYQLLNAL